jgi:hypothetical protein
MRFFGAVLSCCALSKDRNCWFTACGCATNVASRTVLTLRKLCCNITKGVSACWTGSFIFQGIQTVVILAANYFSRIVAVCIDWALVSSRARFTGILSNFILKVVHTTLFGETTCALEACCAELSSWSGHDST